MDRPNHNNPDRSEEHAAPATRLDILEIMALLPHRYPFLLIDRVVEMERMKRIVAIKNVTINEPFFEGHFPAYPIMPGVLIVEAIAQAGGALLLTEVPDRENKLLFFTGIEDAKFRRAVVPGDQVRIEVDVLQYSRRGAKMQGNAYVDGKLVCEATVRCQVVPRQRKPESAQSETAEPEALEPVGLSPAGLSSVNRE
jgi:3-hydroxyacyl-[acyl-carrier-protein] dehydratase